MTGMDDDVRDSLQRRAEDVPPHREVPPDLGKRAGRRIARNSIAAGAVAVVVIAGAVIGVPALMAPSESELGGNDPTETSTSIDGPPVKVGPTPSSPGTATSGDGAIARCTAGQLRANGNMLGAAGSREGVIDVT